MCAYNSGNFTPRNVTVHGCKYADAERLGALVRKRLPSSLLRADLSEVRRLLESQAWVKRAEIRRVLPSDLVVDIEERVPEVILELQGELMLADRDGVLLDKCESRYGKLDVPVFSGLLGETPQKYRLHQQENSERVRLGLKLLSELESGSPDYAGGISEVDLSDKGNVRVLLVDDTVEVMLGDHDFLKRYRTLMSNLPQYRELKSEYEGITSIDLRFEGQIVYRPAHVENSRTATVSAGKK